MVTSRFADFIMLNGQAHGMMLRFCYPPHPVAFVPRDVLHGYIDKEDPITGRPLMQEIVDALTRPSLKKRETR